MQTIRDYTQMDERIEYAMYAPEVGVIGHHPVRFYAYIDGQYIERRTRESLALLLIKAWDTGVKTGA